MSLLTPFEQTVARQREAADPSRSAFVAANAGSGKTRVLTDRVARLLLAGADPAKILCITYTKAAAAEMAHRLFHLLGEWALKDDDALAKDLNNLEGTNSARSGPELANARRLFARALETPGGLKIQTIHAFCETVLGRFPLEAGVPPGFSILDEAENDTLLDTALKNIASGPPSPAKEAMALLAKKYSPDRVAEIVKQPVFSRQLLSEQLEQAGGWMGLAKRAQLTLGIVIKKHPSDVVQDFLATQNHDDLSRAMALSHELRTEKRHNVVETALSALFAAKTSAQQWLAIRKIAIKEDGAPRKDNPIPKRADKIDPWLRPFIGDLAAQIININDDWCKQRTLHDSLAYYTLLEPLLDAYTKAKRDRAVIDYDDMIIATRTLLRNQDANAWVMYKLDHGLEHILLDEAQDTSPAQWDIVEAPLTEFFAGEGVRDTSRSFFAVGDLKQSIYSFQGADAGLFSTKLLDLGQRLAASTAFKAVPLDLSFRSTAPVLQFVDAAFADQAVRRGLTSGGADETIAHGLFRTGDAGRVELWPLVPKPETTTQNAWDAPLDMITQDDPVRTLSDAVASQIRRWLDQGEILRSQGRAIEPSDIIILVQSRKALFHQMIASLSDASIPVAGADKLSMFDDPAVQDLLSYTRTALLPQDDLSLAELLKSPFFNYSEQSLFDLAHGRSGSLWQALRGHAKEDASHRAVLETIQQARAIGLKKGPYAFYMHLLEGGSPSGRRKLYERLSKSVREPLDAFLRQAMDFESRHPRSLQLFLQTVTQSNGEVKREAEQGANSVRVMTVHGAKGLEGEIVFLLDAHKKPNIHLGPALNITAKTGDNIFTAPLLIGDKALDPSTLQQAREDGQLDAYEEYRRLFYVAATRAKERLFICGLAPAHAAKPGKAAEKKTWHELAADAFDRLDHVETYPHPSIDGDCRVIENQQTTTVEAKQPKDVSTSISVAPCLFSPAPAETPVERLVPSRLADEEEAHAEPAAYSPQPGTNGLQRGLIIHRLLELLPDVPTAQRETTAGRLMDHYGSTLDQTTRSEWTAEVLAVVNDAQFAPAFSTASRAEVAIAGRPQGVRQSVIISGKIDRLALSDDRVLVIDYKTNRPPPPRVEEVSNAYLAQMAGYRALLRELYPTKTIESALLWTYEARLTVLPDTLLDQAFVRYLT